MTPTISVVIPALGDTRYLGQAVRSAKTQTRAASEILVVGPGAAAFGSDDGVVPVATAAETLAGARNDGAARSSGTLIGFLDALDVWYPDHLERTVAAFLEPRSVPLGWSYGEVDEIDIDGNLLVRRSLRLLGGEHPKRDIMALLREDAFIRPSAALIALDAFNAVGGFDARLSAYEDDDLFLRLFRAGYDNTFTDESVCQWRARPDLGRDQAGVVRSRALYARKLFDAFPDDAARARFFTRDLIAPRFYPGIVDAYRAAVLDGGADELHAARTDLDAVSAQVRPRLMATRPAGSVLVSAIVPLYNGAPYIANALRSILAQTSPVAEIIVIDDGSSDDGPAIVQRMAPGTPIKLLRKPNGGQSSARNMGVANSAGEYVAFLDQDDLWYPDHIERLVEPVLKPEMRNLGWTYGNLDEVDVEGNVMVRSLLTFLQSKHPKRDIVSILQRDMFILPSASLVSRAAFDAVGGFDERLSGYEDDDLFWRMFRANFDCVFVEHAVTQWRIYPASTSYSPRMAASRAIYARKLMDEYPDDRERERFYTRDLLVPRFFPQMVTDYMKAKGRRDADLTRKRRDDLHVFDGKLGWRRGTILAILKTVPSGAASRAVIQIGRSVTPRIRAALNR